MYDCIYSVHVYRIWQYKRRVQINAWAIWKKFQNEPQATTADYTSFQLIVSSSGYC